MYTLFHQILYLDHCIPFGNLQKLNDYNYIGQYSLMDAGLQKQKDQARLQKKKALDERLNRLSVNGQAFMNKVDQKLDSLSLIKETLEKEGKKMDDVQDRFEKVMVAMGERLAEGMSLGNSFSKDEFNKFRPEKGEEKFVVKNLRQYKQICILTGAGVSKNSGIPTFRGSGGLYSNNFNINGAQYSPEKFLTTKNFEKNPEQVWKWVGQLRLLIHSHKPCQDHKLIHDLASKLVSQGFAVTLVTTNVDGYHLQARTEKSVYRILETHGNIDYVLCNHCSHKSKIDAGKDEKLPQAGFRCQQCQGQTCRPWVMFFDEFYDSKFDVENLRSTKFPFVFCIGTSLQTGLSIKLVSQASQIVEINPSCNIEAGRVHQFHQDCSSALLRIITAL